MKKEIMICDCCGREFYSEYWDGGYIDHYVNFAANRLCLGRDLKTSLEAICFKGNAIRNSDDIRNRLKCYLTWNTVSDELKAQVQEKVSNFLKNEENIEKKVNNVIKEMTEIEKYFLEKRFNHSAVIGMGTAKTLFEKKNDLVSEYIDLIIVIRFTVNTEAENKDRMITFDSKQIEITVDEICEMERSGKLPIRMENIIKEKISKEENTTVYQYKSITFRWFNGSVSRKIYVYNEPKQAEKG